MLKKLIFSVALLATGAFHSSAANEYGIPENIQDCNILHCFDWTFTDIKASLPEIAKAGFGAVQVSPVQGNCGKGAEWFYAYMPYDFVFKANGNGSREQLRSLCEEAEKYGIKIVVDVVANHVNQASGYHDKWWDANGRVRWNGGINYGDRNSITHGQLGEYGDVNSEDAEVQQRCKAFIEDLKSLGVKGIRWDAAKHIGLPSEGCNFWPTVCSVPGMWHYGEILDGPGGDKYKLLKEYCNNISVTDSEYSNWVKDEVYGGRVPSGGGSWTANNVPSEKIVYWGESHDTYSNDGQYGWNSSSCPQDKIDRMWAIGACRNGESSLYFSRPSATSRTAIKMGQKGSTHFTSKEIAAVNHLRNAMTGTPDYYSANDGVACITRKGGGACIVVGAGGSRSVSVSNGGGYLPAGTYTDEVSGNQFTATSTTISGTVGSTGIAVIYGEVRLEPVVTFSPEGGKFRDKITVTATAVNATSAWYKIGAGEQVAFTGSKSFEIGEGMNEGESVTVSWSATGKEGTKTGEVTFTKTAAPVAEENTIYYDNSRTAWSTPYIHYWGGTEQTTWPGVPMEKVEGNIWKKKVADGTTGCLFNAGDGDATKTRDFVAVMGHVYDHDSDLGEYGGETPVQMPSQLYLIGTVAGNTPAWNTANPLTMTKTAEGFLLEGAVINAAEDDTMGYFSFVTTTGASWDVVNQSDRYGSEAGLTSPQSNTLLTPGAEATIVAYPANVSAMGATAWTITPGTYNVEANFKTMKLKLTSPTGVEYILDLDETPIYFDMQGRRVSNPEAGLYIVRRGKKVTKEYVR